MQSLFSSDLLSQDITGVSDPLIFDSTIGLPSPQLNIAIPVGRRARDFLYMATVASSSPSPAYGFGPFVRYLPDLHAQAKPDSALALASDALAYATFSLVPEYAHCARRASVAYGKALRAVGKDIKDESMSRSNEVLMATMLLSCYEVSAITHEI